MIFLTCCSLVPKQKYCESVYQTRRRKTRTVMVGNVALGSDHPMRIQTMTTSDTKDVAKTVEEVCAPDLKCTGVVLTTVCGCQACENPYCFRCFSLLLILN